MSKYPKILLSLALFSGANLSSMQWAYKGLSAGLSTLGFGAVVGYPAYKTVTDESKISWGKKVPATTQAFIHEELRKAGKDPKGVEAAMPFMMIVMSQAIWKLLEQIQFC